jgi:hypothetical protein
MILLDNEPEARNKHFGKSADLIAQLVKRYSVRLDDGSRFMGSGAMVFCSSSPPYVYVLTAKHNLTKFGEQESLGVPAWTDAKAISALHKKFLEKVMIRSGDVSARISNIFYFGNNWTYDVCCLTSNDPKLYGLWRDADSKLTPLLWWGDSDYQASGRLTSMLDLFAEDDETQTLSENNKTRLGRGYYFVQTGFGCNSYKAGKRTQDNINSEARGTLIHRHLTLTDYWAVGHDVDGEKDNVIHCVSAASASETATSAPGDSGGGVFALEKEKSRWMLAGVNLGSNMHREAGNRIHNAPKAENNVFTVLRERVLKPTEADTYTVLDGKIVGAKKDEAFARFWAKGEAVDADQESEVEQTEIEPVISGSR